MLFHPHFSCVIIVSDVSPSLTYVSSHNPIAVISAYSQGSWRACAGEGSNVPHLSQKLVAKSQTSVLCVQNETPPHPAVYGSQMGLTALEFIGWKVPVSDASLGLVAVYPVQ